MPPPTQRWIRSVGDREGADREREVEVAVRMQRPSAPIEAPRPTGSSAAMWSSAAIFGAPVTEPPGKVAASSSARSTSLAERPLHRGDEVRDAGEPALGQQLGPADEPGLADAREVVALEVDDHHVLGRVLLGRSQFGGASGRVPLMGIVQTLRPRRARKSSGDAETIAQPSLASGARLERPSGARRGREPGRVAGERRREVLDEVHLVDVAARDRRPHELDGARVLRRRPGPLPGAELARRRAFVGRLLVADPDGTRRRAGADTAPAGAGAAVRRSGAESP